MNYSEPLPTQLYDFLLFFGFGFLEGLLFKIVEFIRKIFGEGKRAYLIQDLFFSVFSTILMFVFLLVYADGEVRFNLIASSVLGAAVFFFTVGKPVGKALDLFSLLIRKTASALAAPFLFVSKKLKALFEKLFGRTKEKFNSIKAKKKPKIDKTKKKEKKIRKKPWKKRKKDLKNSVKSL